MTALIAHRIALPGRLQPTDLSAEIGQLVAVIGPNGGGKTSLLRALARIETSHGAVSIAGRDLDSAPESERRHLLAYLPASRDVRWSISVRDVIALGLAANDPDRVDAMIETFDLSSLADRRVDSLSTGERARVLMARAFAAEPKALLLDEPLSNLDPYWVLRLVDEFRRATDSGQILLVALHDLSLLDRFDRAILVANGRIQMDETPAGLLADERFETIFRVRQADGRWQLIPPADPRSSQ